MGLYVHRSNRLERLLDVLAFELDRERGAPLQRRVVGVQSQGMRTWIRQQLAARRGVAANLRLEFPRSLVSEAFQAVIGEPDAERFDPAEIGWTIASLLPGLVGRPSFGVVARYLRGEDDLLDDVKLHQLARRIAGVFDQYAVFRPELVIGWCQGGGDWQGELWRELVRARGAHFTAARERLFAARLARLRERPEALPARLHLFGLASLPPLHLHVFSRLARLLDVHLYVPSPSNQYWADLRSERQLVEEVERTGLVLPEALDLELAGSPPLLTSLGRAGRDFQRLLEMMGDYSEPHGELYVDPLSVRTDLLAMLQHDVFALERRTARTPVAAKDASLRVHSCHSALREVEVLRDQLLAAFEELPELTPRDVIVMTPDVETYAPLVQAVFASGGVDAIPCTIADRSARHDNPVTAALLALLDWVGGRAELGVLEELLAHEALAAGLGVDRDALAAALAALRDAGVRFAENAAHRATLGLPAGDEHSFARGLSRLWLGWFAAGAAPFAGLTPGPALGANTIEALGQLSDALDRWFSLGRALRQPRSVTAWVTLLSEETTTSCKDARFRDDLAETLRALAAVGAEAEAGGFAAELGFEAFLARFEEQAASGGGARGFLAGRVTVCAFVPLRTIPFRVVCLVGMEDGAFPRQDRPLDFDLIAREPRLGDRSVRIEDRHLFLEALLAARDRLIISYRGRSARDDAALPPSVVVAELLDALDEGFSAAPGAPERPWFVQHPLQPFDPRYFDGRDPRLFSYSKELAVAARSTGEREPSFFSSPIAAPAAEVLAIDDLVRFLRDPSGDFLRRGVGLRLEAAEGRPSDEQPFDLDPLERWQIATRVVAELEAGRAPTRVHAELLGRDALPPGQLGRIWVEELIEGATRAIVRARELRGAPRGGPLELAVEVEVAEEKRLRVEGALDAMGEAARAEVSCSKLDARGRLALWVRHLVLNAAGHELPSHLVARDDELALRSIPAHEARRLLAELVVLYQRGAREPLCFFPRAAFCYAEARGKGKERDAALDAAEAVFDGDRDAERAEPGVAIAQRGREPLGDGGPQPSDFEALSLAIFAPLFAHAGGGEA